MLFRSDAGWWWMQGGAGCRVVVDAGWCWMQGGALQGGGGCRVVVDAGWCSWVRFFCISGTIGGVEMLGELTTVPGVEDSSGYKKK